jgi:hypothetical protein
VYCKTDAEANARDLTPAQAASAAEARVDLAAERRATAAEPRTREYIRYDNKQTEKNNVNKKRWIEHSSFHRQKFDCCCELSRVFLTRLFIFFIIIFFLFVVYCFQ